MKHNVLFICIIVLTLVFLSVIVPTNYTGMSKSFFVQCLERNGLVSYNTGWRSVGHSYEEQRRLKDLSTMIVQWSLDATDNVPTVPALSADGHLLVLSAAASRVRYGMMVTFIMVYPDDMKKVLTNNPRVRPISSHAMNLWCIFDDGSVTSAYSYDSRYGNDRVSLLDCSLSPYASDELWRRRRTLRVYLVSLNGKDRQTPILKALITVPKPASIPLNLSQQQLTLCTSPLHNGHQFLAQWILFHHIVGFHRIVVYNSTDTGEHLKRTIDAINQQYPDLVDVVQWNFSSLALKDVLSTRYFQTEALHDCLIRYGDQSEWLGTLDLDEYVVPLSPHRTISDYLHQTFGRRIIGSINLWSQFFCTKHPAHYTFPENETSQLVIERFTLRARDRHKRGREKYLYRPRFAQYLSIHHQVAGLRKQEPSSNAIMLAHYAAMNRFRKTPNCQVTDYVQDTSIRERFASRLLKMIAILNFQ